ncbi:prepilin-type N-terminal cleavage/methylation domain-containing protein [Acetobacterium carbinolicum]|jgi:type IV pilus assembly protein PilA|uniref:prepilin-type N-terminal cleavage/methylation domain-containing protein n=1 Tax=Acetobacterium TaxID=33951 RepID=UPI000DBEBB2D|nr:prepilin-type N-terminal cleavage/methylation domain-containing protein [Acetobacterium sp. KB-1]AWW27157.1 hypothetical protein DOZ58_11260 [Acetobacterium sp. KB-1]
MEWIKKQRDQKKGFTLVEIIVVLVVLAILAAFTIPTMLGFVADARGKAYIAEAREVYVAAQAVATEFSGITDLTDSESNQWFGLSNCLGSTKISYRSKYKPDHFDYDSPRVQASLKMFSYLRSDLEISDLDLMTKPQATPENQEAAWTVTVGVDPADGKTGKVNKVVYLKNGYRVTIENNNTSVAKW